jgi:glycosyltransferase involved in cell wall biosynthesis
MNKISVIIPVYNSEKYLNECLQSILGQTLNEIEIICVNDGSSDKSLYILKKFADKDKRVQIINHHEHLGASAARNSALRNVSGEYIGFVDSDDWIDSDFYEVLYGRAKEKDADIVRAVYKYSYKGKEIDSEINKMLEEKYNGDLPLGINEHSVVMWNAIYRLQFLKDKKADYFDEDLLYANDVPFTARVTFSGGRMFSVAGSYYHYRKDVKNQLTVLSIARIKSVLASNKKVIDHINSVQTDKKDYLEAFSRCMWRYNYIFSQALKIDGFNEDMQLYNAKDFMENFDKCRYKENFKNNNNNIPYVHFFSDKDIEGYIKSKQKTLHRFLNYIKKFKTRGKR